MFVFNGMSCLTKPEFPSKPELPSASSLDACQASLLYNFHNRVAHICNKFSWKGLWVRELSCLLILGVHLDIFWLQTHSWR